MPWVRIDENAMEHPKIAGLSDAAFRLWVTGLAYCQKFLTDGYISDVALRGLRAYSLKRKAEIVRAGLWHECDAGVTVHDFPTGTTAASASWPLGGTRESGCRDCARVRANNNRTQSERTQKYPVGTYVVWDLPKGVWGKHLRRSRTMGRACASGNGSTRI